MAADVYDVFVTQNNMEGLILWSYGNGRHVPEVSNTNIKSGVRIGIETLSTSQINVPADSCIPTDSPEAMRTDSDSRIQISEYEKLNIRSSVLLHSRIVGLATEENDQCYTNNDTNLSSTFL